MKHLIYLLSAYCLIGCGNKKEEIVEQIKRARNERAESELNRGWYSSAASRLQSYNTAYESNRKYKSKQMEMDAQAYKEGYERAIQNLKGVSQDILNDPKKLDSVAFIWEMKSRNAQRKVDSLELELKKY